MKILKDLKTKIKTAQLKAAIEVNQELIELYSKNLSLGIYDLKIIYQ